MTAQNANAGEQKTLQIPRKEWGSFLVQFTEMNEDTTVRVEALNVEGVGADILTEDAPLLSVTLDDEAGPPQIVLECGSTGGGSPSALKHIITNPTSIRARQLGPAVWDALQIESQEGPTIVLTVNPHPGRGDLNLENVGRSEVHF